MRWLDIIQLRLRSILHRRQLDEELDEELRFHLEREMEEQRLTSPAGIEQRKEECRDARGLNLIDNTVQDLRYALRQLRKSPGFAVTTLFVLTLGISAAVTVLAFVDAALIQPLPYRGQSRLIGIYESSPSYPRSIVSYEDFNDWQRLNTVFSSMGAFALNGNFTLTKATGAEQVPGTRVSSGFFRTLGVTPVLGRDFLPAEDSNSAAHTVILSYEAWQKRFGGKRDVLGRVLNLNGAPTTVIGVLPRDFQFALYGGADFWGNLRSDGGCEQRRGCRNLLPIGRLKDGVSIEQAGAQMRGIVHQLQQQYPADNSDLDNANLIPLRDLIIGDVRPILLVLLAGAGLLLLISCVNVSTLLLARSDKRRREFAVRSALGASSSRLFRQFALEGILLAGLGCCLGLVLADWTLHTVVNLVPVEKLQSMPFLRNVGLSPLIIGIACSACTLAGAWFAIIPIARTMLSETKDDLKEGARGCTGMMWGRLGARLVIVEVALAMVLMVGAGLLGKSLYLLLHLDVGFAPDHLACVQTSWRPEEYKSAPQQVRLAREIEARVRNLPGVKSVGLTLAPPIDSDWGSTSFHIAGKPERGETNEVYNRPVSSGYFTTLGARIVRGRDFREDEDASKPKVAIVNQALVNRYFAGEDPIGRQIYYDWAPKSPMQIVGVVADIKEGTLPSANMAAVYAPFNQQPSDWPAVVIRTREREQDILPRVAGAIHEIDPFISVSGQQTMTERINRSPAAYLHRSAAVVAGGFAVVAFLLSVVGLYGVIAYSVSQRTREIGLRVALGAERSTVHRMILSEAGRLTGTGVALGLVGSLAAATLLQSLLFGVHSWDVPTLLGVAAVLGLAALLASYVPARRAAAVNPVEALRSE